MQSVDTAPLRPVKARSSLACLPCRSRHLKCDGKKPVCTRCTGTDNNDCSYTRSRRGGLDRAALAERRKRIAENRMITSSNCRNQTSLSPGLFIAENILVSHQDDALSALRLSQKLVGTSSRHNIHDDRSNIEFDPLIDLYYRHFHRHHPLVLPRKHLIKFHLEAENRSRLAPLLPVIRLIGYLYSERDWPLSYASLVDDALSQATALDPFVIQARLLYSIALFWYGLEDASQQQMDIAVQVGLESKIYLHEFANAYNAGDPVLAESWRRTWWTMYILDAYYAGTMGTTNFRVEYIDATAGLPCEEADYERGQIPEPATIEEFDSREFDHEEKTFSSFAYLIGAVKSVVSAALIVRSNREHEMSASRVTEANSSINGWLLLLPKTSEPIMKQSGEIDELMFQAHLIAHTAFIGLHRPLSELYFNSIEEVSRCSHHRIRPRISSLFAFSEVHTMQVLRSIEAQINLLALPVPKFSHSPFVTCMITQGILALLSGCTFSFKDQKLSTARDQIRMAIGRLRDLAEIWPRTLAIVREVQTIARTVLKLGQMGTEQGEPLPHDFYESSNSAIDAVSQDRRSAWQAIEGAADDEFSTGFNDLADEFSLFNDQMND